MKFSSAPLNGPCLAATILSLYSQASGAGFFIPNQGAAATARGNAWAATADSPAAIHYNPAGLTQIDAPTIETGLYGIQLGNKVTINGQTFRAENEWQPVPSFFYAQPLRDDLTLGLGIHSPFGLGTDWGDDTPFRQITTEAELINIRASAVVGYRVNDSLSLGLGVSLNFADASLTQGLLPYNPAAPSNDFVRFEGDDFAATWIASLLWQPHPQHSFAAVYRSEANYELSGTLRGTPGFGLPIGRAGLDILTPATATVGYAFKPTERLTIEANIEWVDWNQLNAITIDTPFGSLPTQRFDWESTFIYEIGLSYKLDDQWTFHLGYDYNEGAQPDQFYNPAVADADRHWLNAGLTYRTDTWDVQLAYQFGFSDHKVTGSQVGTNGDYRARHHAISIATRIEF